MGKQMWNKFASLTSRQRETAPGENIQRGVPTNVNNIGALNMIVCRALRAKHGRNSMFASVGAHLHMAASSCSALPSVNIIICHGEGIIGCQGAATHAEKMLRVWLLEHWLEHQLLEHWLEHQLLEHWSSLQNPLLACSGSPGWPGPAAKLIFPSHFPLCSFTNLIVEQRHFWRLFIKGASAIILVTREWPPQRERGGPFGHF